MPGMPHDAGLYTLNKQQQRHQPRSNLNCIETLSSLPVPDYHVLFVVLHLEDSERSYLWGVPSPGMRKEPPILQTSLGHGVPFIAVEIVTFCLHFFRCESLHFLGVVQIH